jgi:hypothetical protein
MIAPAAIGFRAHSGWAAAVAVAGPVETPAVITRRRIEMGLAQPYHASVGLEIGEARQLIANCEARAASLAIAALRGIVADVRALGHDVTCCGLLLASGRPLPPLESILASHPLLHTAEGELFREALREAARACGLPLTTIKERELKIEGLAAIEPPGPPWRQDQKFAALAAIQAQWRRHSCLP